MRVRVCVRCGCARCSLAGVMRETAALFLLLRACFAHGIAVELLQLFRSLVFIGIALIAVIAPRLNSIGIPPTSEEPRDEPSLGVGAFSSAACAASQKRIPPHVFPAQPVDAYLCFLHFEPKTQHVLPCPVLI